MALVAYGNLVSLADHRLVPSLPYSALLALPATAVLLWYAHRVEGLTWRELGCQWHGSLQAWGTGTLVGLALALPAVVGLLFPPLLGEPVTYRPVDQAAFASLVLRAGLTMPLGTVLVEEGAFRGVLLASLARRYPRGQAALLSSATFMLWHPAVIGFTMVETNLTRQPLFFVLGVLLAHLVVFTAGLVFCWLALTTRRITAPIAAHWVTNTAILAFLWLR